MDSTEQ